MQLRSLLFLSLVTILISGCGGGNSADSAHGVSQVAASQGCMDLSCHGAKLSPVTGKLIAQEWQGSPHMTQNAAGCADCHEPDAGHPNLCNKCHGGGGFQVTRNPDQAGKCGKCHGPAHPEDVMMAQAPQHYGYSSATALPQTKRASYLSGQYQGRCRACHNPHGNTVTPQHREYAKSLHGDPQGAAWTHYEFKKDNYNTCYRCHTATGFISYVTSGFTVPAAGLFAGDTSAEMLACDACHSSYDFKNSIRSVPAFTAGYKGFNGVDKALFPDNGKGNLCIPCHSGRESGQAINDVADFSNANFKNSHYLAAAGLMYMQIGFTNFTSPDAPIGSTTYGKTLSPDDISTPGGVVGGTKSTHRRLGTPLITNVPAGTLDQNGPCVTCHMNASGVAARYGNGHSLKIDDNAYNQVCKNCHTSEEGVPLSAANFHSAFLEPQAEVFEHALELTETVLLQRHQISYNEAAYPYFFDERLPLLNGKKQPVKDWTRGGTVDGRKLMGACFNFNLLVRDPAAYAHARSYSRRLIYDSLDFLDDGGMNLSVGATALAQSQAGSILNNPLFGIYTKGAKAFNSQFVSTDSNGVSRYGSTTRYAGTSEAMLYLIGWSRSATTAAQSEAEAAAAAGAWAAVERP